MIIPLAVFVSGIFFYTFAYKPIDLKYATNR